uniref:Glycine rich superfamily member n=1 Tax=Rhipicephalus zambeziensis TaxID=60191 RepID=A0A224Y3U2_9ACAR
MSTNTRMAALFAVVALLLCVRTSSGQGNSYSVSSFHHESFGPDGIVMGRSGYKDSSGKSRFTHYQVGKDGRKKFIRDDPEGDIESRSLLPDPSKVGFGFPGGFPGFGDPHLDFFKALGFPKSAFFPGFPQDLLPRDLLPPSVASGSGGFGQGVEGRKGSTNNNFPTTSTTDFFGGSLLPPLITTQHFFPPDLLPRELQTTPSPGTSGTKGTRPAPLPAVSPGLSQTPPPQNKRIPPPPVPREQANERYTL